ncbi:MAG: nucleotide exchange factor GrpE [Haloquadratum sp.]
MSEESPEGQTTAASSDTATDEGKEGIDADVDTDADADADADADVAAADDATGSSAGTEGDGASAGTDRDAIDTEVPDVASRVAEYDDDLADEVAELESRLESVASELDQRAARIEELESALKRSKADFQNYKKRAKQREEEIRERATEDFVSRVVDVRDNLVRALEQDEDADIRPGVESTLEEFDRVLDEENVSTIDPEVGSEVDPMRHEVLMRVDSDQPEGTIADVYQQGYEMAGSVLREAQVTVSTAPDDENGGGDGESES